MGDLSGFDELDRRIIEAMCVSSQGSYRQMAKQLGVHPTTLIQRVKALESKGVVRGYRAKIDYMAMGYEFMGMVSVVADDVVSVEKELVRIPEVMSVYDVTGEADCVVMVSCLDRESFSDAVKRISAIPGVRKTITSVVLDVVKAENEFVPDLTGGRE